jgi:hypothetical protein
MGSPLIAPTVALEFTGEGQVTETEVGDEESYPGRGSSSLRRSG